MRLLFSYRNHTNVHRFQVNTITGHLVEEMAGVRESSSTRPPFSFICRVVNDRSEVLRIWDQRGDRSKAWLSAGKQ